MRSADQLFRSPDIQLLIRDVKEGKKRPVTVRSWACVKDVKDVLQKLMHVPAHAQRLFFGPIGELPNHRALADAGIYRSGETLSLLVQTDTRNSISSASSLTNDVAVVSSMHHSTPRALKYLVNQARRGFAVGLKPEFVLDGSGGTYFMHDASKNRIAVFKPADEEPYAENNPRGYIRQTNESMRQGIAPGEACIREVAAYMLSPDVVPMTTLVEARHPTFNTNGSRLTVAEGGASIGAHSISPGRAETAKNKAGSFQEFVRCECTMDDISPSKISTEQVHKIAILDIRVMNADRNSANLLVRRRQDNSLELVPIDHGYCLRSVCDVSWMDWCWLDWPQMKKPLSDYHKKYIESLDIEADAQRLQDELNICQEAIDYFRASNALLKAGVKAGLTLYDIAILCCRNDNLAEVPSMMEKLFSMASELAHAAVQNDRWHHSAASRAIVEQLTPHQRRFSVLTTESNSSASRPLLKSASSAGIASLPSNSSSGSLGVPPFVLEEEGDALPGMTQSAASDSSSENEGHVDVEDCGEWAANVIADVSVDQIVPVRPHRSASNASDEGSKDSEQRGFWCVNPGSYPPSIASDDGSYTWSPQSTPRGSMHETEDLPELSLDAVCPKTPTVSFTMPTGPFIPPATVDIGSTKNKGLSSLMFAKPDTSSGMPRSKSYSSLPRGKVMPQSAPDKPEAYGNYRKYFHNFIDLVIVRETTAALRTTSD